MPYVASWRIERIERVAKKVVAVQVLRTVQILRLRSVTLTQYDTTVDQWFNLSSSLRDYDSTKHPITLSGFL